MKLLVLGLLLLLGTHSVRIVADSWRKSMLARHGTRRWKLIFSLLSLLGLATIVWGFGVARQTPLQLWSPAPGLRHVAALLTLPAFVLLTSAYVPGNRIQAHLRHPMVAAVALWALAHLLSNGNREHLVLFGSFFVWAVLSGLAAWRRDRREPPAAYRIKNGATGIAVAMGVAAWVGFTLWLHGLLIGVRPWG